MKPLLFALAPALFFAGCAQRIPQAPATAPTPNTITARARIVPADYGNTYEFKGDRILRYPDFDVVLVSTEPFHTSIVSSGPAPANREPDGEAFNFEARDRSGKTLASFSWATISGDAGTFTVRGRGYRFGAEDGPLWISGQ